MGREWEGVGKGREWGRGVRRDEERKGVRGKGSECEREGGGKGSGRGGGRRKGRVPRELFSRVDTSRE